MSTENTYDTPPFPEAVQAAEDKTIKEQYSELLQREAAQAQRELETRLDEINRTGGVTELTRDMKLRFEFEKKFGYKRFGELHLQHIRQARKVKNQAELQSKMNRSKAR